MSKYHSTLSTLDRTSQPPAALLYIVWHLLCRGARARAQVLWIAARIALVSAAAGIVIGLAFDSFLGALLAHWMQSAFAAGSLFAAAALLALSALLACLLPATPSPSHPPKLSAMNKACPI